MDDQQRHERFPVECDACGGTGFGRVGWLPSGGVCSTCRGNGSRMMTDAERFIRTRPEIFGIQERLAGVTK